MESISVADVQHLVSQLPDDKLPHAYRLLRDLAEQPNNTSLQVEFMLLPLDTHRQLLTQQAADMIGHYEQTAVERVDWQGGDLQDDC